MEVLKESLLESMLSADQSDVSLALLFMLFVFGFSTMTPCTILKVLLFGFPFREELLDWKPGKFGIANSDEVDALASMVEWMVRQG
jgi:hypothetical protein